MIDIENRMHGGFKFKRTEDDLKVNYNEGGIKLLASEYYLKLDVVSDELVGFLAKPTQKGKVPLSFVNWRTKHIKNQNYQGDFLDSKLKRREIDCYLFTEIFREGWEFVGFRWGQSQSWARVKHPVGFILEIYASNLKEIILENNLNKGVIEGMWKWEKNKLIKSD